MSPLASIAVIGIGLSLLFAVTWLVARRVGKWAIVDPVWSFSIGLSAVAFALLSSEGQNARKAWIAVAVAAYSVRLGAYLALRVASHRDDDPRYVRFAADWGSAAESRMFRFFQIQALSSLALSLPIFIALSTHSNGFRAWDAIGIAIMATAVAGEWLSDAQLARFKRDNREPGAVCRIGLWRYSRHPNYFFQWVFWLSFPLLCVGSPYWWLSPTSAAMMYYFLNYATGIPPTERRALESKGAAYRKYQDETSAFFPMPPRKRFNIQINRT